jgi:hypothetical protein
MSSENVDPRFEVAINAERQRCIKQVLAYAALREQAAIDLDRADAGDGDDKPSEGASERARMQADVARDIANFLSEDFQSAAPEDL